MITIYHSMNKHRRLQFFKGIRNHMRYANLEIPKFKILRFLLIQWDKFHNQMREPPQNVLTFGRSNNKLKPKHKSFSPKGPKI